MQALAMNDIKDTDYDRHVTLKSSLEDLCNNFNRIAFAIGVNMKFDLKVTPSVSGNHRVRIEIEKGSVLTRKVGFASIRKRAEDEASNYDYDLFMQKGSKKRKAVSSSSLLPFGDSLWKTFGSAAFRPRIKGNEDAGLRELNAKLSEFFSKKFFDEKEMARYESVIASQGWLAKQSVA